MKILKAFVLGLFIFSSFSTMFAFGTFELLDSSSLPSAVAGQPYSRNISFVYSGDWVPSANIIGNNLPEGMKIGNVYKKSTGFYYFIFSGIPTTPGQYSFKVFLTDDNGGSLIQSVSFEVRSVDVVAITDTFLPDTKKDKEYRGHIKFKYYGARPSISFRGDLPQGFSSEVSYGYPDTSLVTPVSNGILEIKGTTKKEGVYAFNLVLNSGSFDKSIPLQIVVTPDVAVAVPQAPAQVLSPVPKAETTARTKQVKVVPLPVENIKEEELEVAPTVSTTTESVVMSAVTQNISNETEAKAKTNVAKNFYFYIKSKIKNGLLGFANSL
jgi:hypothetical protein